MAKRLLILDGLSDDEIADILSMLEDENIPYYVTEPGGWMASLNAVWLNNDIQHPQALKLVRDYFHAQTKSQEAINQLINRTNQTKLGALISSPTVVALVIPTAIIVALMIFLLSIR